MTILFLLCFLLLLDHFDCATIYEEQKIIGDSSDNFGYSLSLSGNYSVIGANCRHMYCWGSASVFHFSDGMWTKKQELVRSDVGTYGNALFGRAVSIDGDTLVVGAYRHDQLGMDAGAAYVFRRNGEIWEEKQILLASDGGMAHHFGCSVAISGDWIIVGAEGSKGAVYFFERNGGNGLWEEQQRITNPEPNDGDEFGNSVSISKGVAIVGAHESAADLKIPRSGQAYIFHKYGNWQLKQILNPSDPASSGGFGGSVYVDEGYAIVGASYRTNSITSITRAGGAYVYFWNGYKWTFEGILESRNGAYNEYMGSSVSIKEGVALVGSDGFDGAKGKSYLFAKQYDGTWVERDQLISLNLEESDFFGYSVSLDRKGSGRSLVGGYNGGVVYSFAFCNLYFVQGHFDFVQCDGSCEKNWGGINCNECNLDFHFDQSQCDNSVCAKSPQTQYYGSNCHCTIDCGSHGECDVSGSICECENGWGDTICDKCIKDDEFLNNGECIKCSDEIYGIEYCYSCSGNRENDDNLECTQCEVSAFVNGDTCVEQCPLGKYGHFQKKSFFLDAGGELVCSPCGNRCLECVSDVECTKCDRTSTLFENECVVCSDCKSPEACDGNKPKCEECGEKGNDLWYYENDKCEVCLSDGHKYSKRGCEKLSAVQTRIGVSIAVPIGVVGLIILLIVVCCVLYFCWCRYNINNDKRRRMKVEKEVELTETEDSQAKTVSTTVDEKKSTSSSEDEGRSSSEEGSSSSGEEEESQDEEEETSEKSDKEGNENNPPFVAPSFEPPSFD